MTIESLNVSLLHVGKMDRSDQAICCCPRGASGPGLGPRPGPRPARSQCIVERSKSSEWNVVHVFDMCSTRCTTIHGSFWTSLHQARNTCIRRMHYDAVRIAYTVCHIWRCTITLSQTCLHPVSLPSVTDTLRSAPISLSLTLTLHIQ